MYLKSRTTHHRIFYLALLIALGGVAFRSADRISAASAQGSYDPKVQTAALLFNEARAVYLGNLERRNNGVPPLRWNRQLTYAARWFSWDSTENRPSGFCGHQDTNGQWPSDRIVIFGYKGFGGAENAFCGYLSPEAAIQGWMNSPGHRANLLDPNSREIGLGYYRRASDGRGYVTQDFGSDVVQPPVVIENEAIATSGPNVNLYIYDGLPQGGFVGGAPATEMMVSNSPYFEGAAWEQYNSSKAWTLPNTVGWHNVYVRTRDKFNRTLTAADTIYLGAEANVPQGELGMGGQMSTTQSQVTFYDLNGGGFPQVQFSAGWLADDTTGSFTKYWGNGAPANDGAAWGGTAYRLYPGDGESFAWVYDTSFVQNIPMVAYFRLKVNSNASPGEVARISVQGGSTEYGPFSLVGTDFAAPNQYQEFPVNFTFTPTSNDPFLIFKFWRSGDADLYVDAVSIFTKPQAVTSPLTWPVPGSNYRGQGVWIRYTNGSQFSAISEAQACLTCADIKTVIGGASAGAYPINTYQSERHSYAGTNNGLVKVVSSNSIPIVASERVAYSPDSGTTWTSYSELMGLPANQVGTSYIFPWYNNIDLNSQLRFGNAGSAATTVTVTVGGVVQGSYPLAPNASQRVSYVSLNAGPVKITSSGNVPIIASMRVAYNNGSAWTSFSELMGLPSTRLTTSYTFPWYNNADLNSQLRFGNVGASTTTVTVTVGGQVKGSYILRPNESTRVSYPDLDAGPVKVTSSGNVPIIASMRVAYFDGSSWTDFSELMGMPTSLLSTSYFFPVYNNVDHNTQLRFGNAGTANTTVTVTIGGVVQGTYNLVPNQSTRISYKDLDGGPIVVSSSGGVPIIASERVAYFDGTAWTSFAEMMGLPKEQLTSTYLFPWYNNADLDTELRFGVP